MSLSLHSSMDALTSSKRGLEKDRLIEPEKSSIGESSLRISSRPDVGDCASAVRARHASLPTSQSKDSVWSARRFGTSTGSLILANVVRTGEPGIPRIPGDAPFVDCWRVALPERETAKMRPSKDYRCAIPRSSCGSCCVTAPPTGHRTSVTGAHRGRHKHFKHSAARSSQRLGGHGWEAGPTAGG